MQRRPQKTFPRMVTVGMVNRCPQVRTMVEVCATIEGPIGSLQRASVRGVLILPSAASHMTSSLVGAASNGTTPSSTVPTWATMPINTSTIQGMRDNCPQALSLHPQNLGDLAKTFI